MNCPWCDFQAEPRALHAHLADRHGDVVVMTSDERQARYAITCPRCGEQYSHSLRKVRRDPGFLAEFEREIRLVALDMLLNHLLVEHEPSPTGEDSRDGR